jgi:hypothetical protein
LFEILAFPAQGPMFSIKYLLGYHLIHESAMIPWILVFSGLMDRLEQARRPLHTPFPAPARSVVSWGPAFSVRVTMWTAAIQNLSLPQLLISSDSYSLNSKTTLL